MKLKGKVAIVTGSGQGIGREIALAYAEEGADVVVAERNVSTMEAVAAEIKALGRKTMAVPVDVGVEEQVEKMVQRTLDEFGKIDILVSNAGGSFRTRDRLLREVALQDWYTVINANLTGCFLCSKAVSPQMIKQKSGSIVNVSSNHGKHGVARNGVYCAAKFGIEGLTQVLAMELGPFNIRANCLRPGGSTASPTILNRPIPDPNSLARVDIVRPLAIFLASDDSIKTTGQSIDCREWNPKHGFGDLSQYLYPLPKK